MALLRQNELET